MPKKDLRIIPFKNNDVIGFDVDFEYNHRQYTVSVRSCRDIIRVYYHSALDDTPEFLDKYTRALRVANKLVKKMEKTK